ncbi:MAG TPA: glutamate synthase [Rhodobacteraceae bacterium]|nr:glutamate synthase [Paracoccaceae bacterium]
MKTILMTAALCGLALSTPAQAADNDIDALKAEAAGIVKTFAQELQGELLTAMKAAGPASAISVCNEKAPAIAAAHEAASGWSVARSSHKLRNTDNAPDAYTAAVIADFVAREEAGEVAKSLSQAEIVEEDGQRVFRFVKAIPTGQPCLNCHGGDDVKPEVVAKLAELYPDDAARGFTVDRMRGVFTLSKVLSE